MRGDYFLRTRRFQIERDKMRDRRDAFITTCLGEQTVQERQDQTRTEKELMSVEDKRVAPGISSEAARRLYEVRYAATKLYDRYDRAEDLSTSDIEILLSLGYELMELEGKKGMIPAMQLLQKGRHTRVPRAFETPPSTIFIFPIQEYLLSGEADEGTIFDILAFAHQVYRWTASYLQKHRDVGVPVTTRGLMSPDAKVRQRALDREKRLRGPEANYITSWGAIPFQLYEQLCVSGALHSLSSKKQGEAIQGILKELRHDIFFAQYYNPAFMERLPRRIGIQKTYEALIQTFVLNEEVDPDLQKKIYKELRSVLKNPDLPAVFKESLQGASEEATEEFDTHRKEEIQTVLNKGKKKQSGMDKVLLELLEPYKAG